MSALGRKQTVENILQMVITELKQTHPHFDKITRPQNLSLAVLFLLSGLKRRRLRLGFPAPTNLRI